MENTMPSYNEVENMDEELPVKGRVVRKKWIPPISYKFTFWESEHKGIEYRAVTDIGVRFLPFSYMTTPEAVTEEHLLYMKDKYGFDEAIWDRGEENNVEVWD